MNVNNVLAASKFCSGKPPNPGANSVPGDDARGKSIPANSAFADDTASKQYFNFEAALFSFAAKKFVGSLAVRLGAAVGRKQASGGAPAFDKQSSGSGDKKQFNLAFKPPLPPKERKGARKSCNCSCWTLTHLFAAKSHPDVTASSPFGNLSMLNAKKPTSTFAKLPPGPARIQRKGTHT